MDDFIKRLAIFVVWLLVAAAPSLAEPSAETSADRCVGKVRLHGPVYDYVEGALQPGIAEVLDELAAKFLERCPDKLLIIEAHSAEMPTPELNQRLSELRAHTLRHELAKRGVPDAQLLPVGLGSSRPIAPAGDPDAMNLNRRVTFRVAD